MINISLNTLWKIAVIILLGALVFYGYKIDANTRSPKYVYYYTQTPIYGCGGQSSSGSGGAAPDIICVTPDQAKPLSK